MGTETKLIIYSPGIPVIYSGDCDFDAISENVIINTRGFFLVEKKKWNQFGEVKQQIKLNEDTKGNWFIEEFSFHDFYKKCIILFENPSKSKLKIFQPHVNEKILETLNNFLTM
jgi:hypothetical protein